MSNYDFGAAQRRYVDLLVSQGCNVQVAVSDVCRHTTQLARAWTQIMQPTEETGSESAAAPEVYDALRNALEFGEAERIQFTLATLSNTLTPALNRAAAAQVCHDVLYLVRRWMEQQEDAEGIQALQDVARIQSLPCVWSEKLQSLHLIQHSAFFR